MAVFAFKKSLCITMPSAIHSRVAHDTYRHSTSALTMLQLEYLLLFNSFDEDPAKCASARMKLKLGYASMGPHMNARNEHTYSSYKYTESQAANSPWSCMQPKLLHAAATAWPTHNR